MRTVSASEANQQFSRLLAAVENGDEVVITRRDKPVARLVKTDYKDNEQAERDRRVAAVKEAIAYYERRGPIYVGEWSRESLYDSYLLDKS